MKPTHETDDGDEETTTNSGAVDTYEVAL